MTILAILRALLEALTALARVWPLVMVRQSETQIEQLADELASLADDPDVARADRVRDKLTTAKRYHAALLAAVAGPASGPDRPHAPG
jgi:hypothetical protein